MRESKLIDPTLVLRKITLKIKDAVGKSHSSGGSGPANIFVRRFDGKIIQLPSHGDAHYLPSLLHNLLSVICESAS